MSHSALARAVVGDTVRQEALRRTQDDPQAAERWLFMRWLCLRQFGGRSPAVRVCVSFAPDEEGPCPD